MRARTIAASDGLDRLSNETRGLGRVCVCVCVSDDADGDSELLCRLRTKSILVYIYHNVRDSYLRTKRSKLRSPGRVLPVLILLQSPFQIHSRG